MNHVALRPQHLDILSICTGGGGLDLGVELAIPSARSVVLVEREAFACAQLVSAMEAGLLHPAPVWSDARTFDGRRWRGCVDGLIGGIPCQPHSLAGKREGSDDDRDLWSDARRIIVQSRPWFVLIENVEGMLSAKPGLDPGALRVRRDLQRLGFDIEGGLFTAAEVGASHDRERVFILGVADAQCNGWREGSDVLQPRADQSEPHLRGQVLADANGERLSVRRRSARQAERPNADRCDPELGDAASQRLHAVPLTGAHCCDESGRPRDAEPQRRGGAVVDAEHVRSHGRENAGRVGEQILRCSLGSKSEYWQPSGSGVGLFPPGPSAIDQWRAALERAPELEPAFRRVADGLASRLDIARVDRLRMLGNGVVPLQAAYAVRTLATRLAERGSAGATRLVRMMEEAI